MSATCRLPLVATLTFALAASSRAENDSQPPPAPAEGPPRAEPLAGHSSHGDAFNEGPRGRAYRMDGTGHAHFPITTSVPLAQEFFDQGINQLHGFWYFEAERAFRQSATLDPACAMAYWGMAMANRDNLARARPLIQKAVDLKSGASMREVRWIDVLAAYFKEEKKTDEARRRRELIRGLEAVIHEFPDDLEAKAFLAWAIWDASFHGVPITSHQAVDALIAQVLAVEPRHHGAHHYQIHLWDREKAERALASAAAGGPAAPAIAHMWHMPGHIYSKLERYADAAWQQEASARVDHAYMLRDRVMPYLIHNYAHNNEWCIRDMSHTGRVRDAMRLAKNLIEIPRHPKYNNLAKSESCAAFGRTRLCELLVRYELWDEAIRLADSVYLEPTELPLEQVRRLRLVGAAHLALGHIEQGKQVLAELAQMSCAAGSTSAATPEDDIAAKQDTSDNPDPAERESDKGTSSNSSKENNESKTLRRAIDNATRELEGRLALAEGRYELAFEHFGKADNLANSYLARAHLDVSHAAKAEELAKKAVDSANNQVEPLATLVVILHASGKVDEARTAFAKLQELSAQVDLDVPIFAKLAPVAASLGISSDWRVPARQKSDLGATPNLDDLGPFAWRPQPAEPWELTSIGRDATQPLAPAGGAGKQVGTSGTTSASLSLADFSGRPVIVIFYLGVGCLHCAKQLEAFAPLSPEFAAAGIALVAISSDAPEGLAEAHALFSGIDGREFPFALLSDQTLDTFRAYRAYDGFEDRPLHGTFLIDAAGLIRWQDVSYEPFADAKFLLHEAKRLLAVSSD